MNEPSTDPRDTRIYDRPAIRNLGDAIVHDRDAASPVSHLEEAGAFPPNMRIGWAALGVAGFQLAMKHDEIVGDAEATLTGTIESLHGYREKLHAVSANVDGVEKESVEHVRRI
ncbi:hypothetical protein ACTMTI_46900 [Nonomuraea sp. H19]|uniref:hypothetical protein n=1 Tax=Nonomuraea sp. H19 TaxID=3452206 RepID=UPI003F8A2249